MEEEAVKLNVLEIAANMVRNAVDTMSSKFSAFVKDEINAKVSTLYKPGGAATLATLPALTADNAGYVYDMSEVFTTTASFREGAGHKYPAGTNVVVSDVGDGVYKYDVLSGMLDGYVQESRKVGGVPLTADIPVTLTGDSAITVTNTGTASAIGYSVTHDDSGVTAGSKGDTTNQTPGFGGTFKVLSATVDAKGHVTALGEHTAKIPDTEATQSAKGLMSASDKTKLDTLVDDTLSTTGKAADAKVTGDNVALLKELIQGIDAPIYRKASGNPATFSDAEAANIKALSVTLTPTQSGSGDPSPTNIRPISGVSSVSVTRTGQNGASSQTVTVQLTDGSNLLTVYGGTLDVTTGTLTVTHKGTDMGGLNFIYNSKNDVFVVYIDDCKSPITFGYEDGLCSMFTVFRGEFSQFQAKSSAVIIAPTAWASSAPHLVVSYKGITDSNAFRTAVSGQTIVYPLAAPLTYQLTPQQLATLSGYNSVTTDAGTVSVTYKADASLVWGGG